MALNDTELRYYDNNVLRLPADKRNEYHQQVDRLIETLGKQLLRKANITITKIVKAGSFAKYTILRKTSTDPVDVDVVFYVSGADITIDTVATLNSAIYDILIGMYPTKAVEDFEIQRKAATVTFVGSGLSVDIVPVIEDEKRPGYGSQFDIHDGSIVQTCAPCQIKFVRDRKNQDGDFRTLVRLAKKWRNHAELKPLKSFAIELIMAHLLATQGKSGSIEQRFRNFLLYLAQAGLKEQISWPENTKPLGSFADPVVILDPVYSLNNVTSRISELERLEILAAAETAWEDANFASAENDNEEWKKIFGPRFKTAED